MSGARSPRPRPAAAVMPTPLGNPTIGRQHTQPGRPTQCSGATSSTTRAFLGIIDRREAICQVRAMARSDAEEVSAVLSAYVLIQTEVGKVAHVAQALSDLDGVQLAEDLVGPYDVIARVQAPGLDQLGRLVVARIQVVDGVTRTLTCMVIHR
jgi:hypothetical protein